MGLFSNKHKALTIGHVESLMSRKTRLDREIEAALREDDGGMAEWEVFDKKGRLIGVTVADGPVAAMRWAGGRDVTVRRRGRRA